MGFCASVIGLEREAKMCKIYKTNKLIVTIRRVVKRFRGRFLSAIDRKDSGDIREDEYAYQIGLSTEMLGEFRLFSRCDFFSKNWSVAFRLAE